MGDLVHPAQQYLQYKATWQSAMGIVVYLALPRLASSGPGIPGYHMGPTSGGSIGSQGWWDASSPPHLLLAVHCLMPHSAGRHVAQASRPVLGPHLTSQVLTDPETVWDLLQEGP